MVLRRSDSTKKLSAIGSVSLLTSCSDSRLRRRLRWSQIATTSRSSGFHRGCLYDMAKGIGLIAVVGGLVSGQANWWGAIMGLVGTVTFFLIAYWLEGRRDN